MIEIIYNKEKNTYDIYVNGKYHISCTNRETALILKQLLNEGR